MSKNWEVAKVQSIPTCDICNSAPAVADAPTSLPGNPWGYLCQSCWELDGRWPNKVGCGIGQRLVLEN